VIIVGLPDPFCPTGLADAILRRSSLVAQVHCCNLATPLTAPWQMMAQTGREKATL